MHVKFIFMGKTMAWVFLLLSIISYFNTLFKCIDG